jgi:hypothetical protein
MARLFIGPREMNFIADITKEIIKDVNGQVIYYYPISETKTKTHGIYNEAIEKFFDSPIAIDAFVDAQFQEDTVINQFGIDAVYKQEAFVQYRDLVDKGINASVGDFFSFSDIFYEITQVKTLKNIFGQAEHEGGVVLIGTKSREQQFQVAPIGPTDIKYTDDDAVQGKFVQQRGVAENSKGPTGDSRELVDQGVLVEPLTGPKEVSEQGAQFDNSFYESSFTDPDE